MPTRYCCYHSNLTPRDKVTAFSHTHPSNGRDKREGPLGPLPVAECISLLIYFYSSAALYSVLNELWNTLQFTLGVQYHHIQAEIYPWTAFVDSRAFHGLPWPVLLCPWRKHGQVHFINSGALSATVGESQWLLFCDDLTPYRYSLLLRLASPDELNGTKGPAKIKFSTICCFFPPISSHPALLPPQFHTLSSFCLFFLKHTNKKCNSMQNFQTWRI